MQRQVDNTTHSCDLTLWYFCRKSRCRLLRWLQLRFDFDSTAVRRLFDCLSNVTIRSQWRSHSHPDLLFIYSAVGLQQPGCNGRSSTAHGAVELQSNWSIMVVEL